MTVGAFLIVRLSSTRLPVKAMMKIMDKPIIQLMVERVQASRLVDKIIITTSTESSDDPLEKLASQLGIDCYRGPLDNVMERIRGGAVTYDCDTIVELLGDNPLVHSDLIDDVITLYRDGNYDYVASITQEYPAFSEERILFSLGIRVQVYARVVSEQWKKYPDYLNADDRASSAYIFENPNHFKAGYLEARGKWGSLNRPNLNFAVNYQRNFDFMRRIFQEQYPKNKNFSIDDVMRQLDQDPKLSLLLGSE